MLGTSLIARKPQQAVAILGPFPNKKQGEIVGNDTPVLFWKDH
jgi:hypothetical protein